MPEITPDDVEIEVYSAFNGTITIDVHIVQTGYRVRRNLTTVARSEAQVNELFKEALVLLIKDIGAQLSTKISALEKLLLSDWNKEPASVPPPREHDDYDALAALVPKLIKDKEALTHVVKMVLQAD